MHLERFSSVSLPLPWQVYFKNTRGKVGSFVKISLMYWTSSWSAYLLKLDQTFILNKPYSVMGAWHLVYHNHFWRRPKISIGISIQWEWTALWGLSSPQKWSQWCNVWWRKTIIPHYKLKGTCYYERRGGHKHISTRQVLIIDGLKPSPSLCSFLSKSITIIISPSSFPFHQSRAKAFL